MARNQKTKRKSANAQMKNQPTSRKISKSFHTSQSFLQDAKKESPHLYAALDADQTRIKRRIVAAIRYAPKAKEMFPENRVDLKFPFDVEDDWGRVNSIAMEGYDSINERLHIDVGAALWILDRLSDQQDLLKAAPVLQEVAGMSNTDRLQGIHDTQYGWILIESMVSLIQNRNADCTGIKPQVWEAPPEDADAETQKRFAPLHRVFCDDYTASGKHHQQVDSRRRFDFVMGLINEQTKQKAAAHFEEKIWEFMDRYYQYRETWLKNGDKTFRQWFAMVKRTTQKQKETEERQKILLKNMNPKARPGMPLNLPLSSCDQAASPIDNIMDYKRDLRQVVLDADRIDKWAEEVKEYEQGALDTCYDCYHIPLIPKAIAEDYAFDDGSDAFVGFAVDDPYEMCFALLYLLEQGSDLPWLYFPATRLMNIVAAMLPWYQYDFGSDRYWSDTDNSQESPFDRKPKHSKAPELRDWYSLDYTDRMSDSEEGVNLAQIVYRITGAIMPRNLHRYDHAVRELEQYGLKGKKAQIPLLYCLNLLGSSSHEYVGIYLLQDYLKDEDGDLESLEEEKPEEVSEEPESLDDLKAVIRSQKEEIKRLKGTAYAAHRQVRDLRGEMKKQEAEWQEERQELTDLRELVFHQQEEDVYEATAEEHPIEFPFHTESRIVVFGGHETWLKAIRPMLPNVRFNDRDAQPNENMIRNADIVWIQTNAISHARYYTIMDEVRKYKIPVRYFTCASAERCARQIIAAEPETI